MSLTQFILSSWSLGDVAEQNKNILKILKILRKFLQVKRYFIFLILSWSEICKKSQGKVTFIQINLKKENIHEQMIF